MIQMWTYTTDELPIQDKRIRWIAPGGEEVRGSRIGSLWFLGDGTYVYYTPVMWQYL